MTEISPRDAHTREYHKDGKQAIVNVNDNGLVQVSEELFDVLLRIAGYWETTPPPPGVDVLDTSVA